MNQFCASINIENSPLLVRCEKFLVEWNSENNLEMHYRLRNILNDSTCTIHVTVGDEILNPFWQ